MLQIRAAQRSVAANLQPLTTHIYHVMITVTSGFSTGSFFINIIFISQKLFWMTLNFFSWNLSTFTKQKEPVCFLFICSFFTHCFVIILCINALHLFILFHCVQTWSWVCSLFAHCFTVTPYINTLHLLYFLLHR